MGQPHFPVKGAGPHRPPEFLGSPTWATVWLGGQAVRDAGLAINRSRVRILAFPLLSATPGKLTHMCLCHQAFDTSQQVVISQPCGWEGNGRSGVALATRHRH